ncbi:MAG: EamA family transporter RarD [Propionibacteriaceae bacterium]|nr:EamA family transporter RarD [Propionibacteriaceae bacterium]
MDDSRSNKAGLVAGFAAYILWSVFPLYFKLLGAASPVEIVAHRIVWSLVFCAILLTVTHSWGDARGVVASRRSLLTLMGAGVLVSVNWLIFIAAVNTGHTLDSSLGYFVNPLVTVALAYAFLHERVRPLQLIALAICGVAVLVMIIGYGEFPFIGLSLALTFGVYGLLKNRVAGKVTPVVGLGIETATVSPIALGYIIYLQASGQGHFWTDGWALSAELALAGVVTAIPLLLFAFSAAHLPLTTLGFIQYISPIGTFFLGVFVFHEDMPLARWAGFALIWVALAVLSVDILARTWRGRRKPAQSEQT